MELFLLSVLLALCLGSGDVAAPAEPRCAAGVDGACTAPETLVDTSEDDGSFLQSRSHSHHGQRSEGALGGTSEDEDFQAYLEAEVLESTIVEHGCYKITRHGEKRGNRAWLLRQRNCDTKTLDKIAEALDADVKLAYEGSPDKGGMCLLVVEATLEALKKELKNHDWPCDVAVEEDGIWGLVPEKRMSVSKEESSLRRSTKAASPQSWGLDRIDARKGLDSSYSPTLTGRGVHVFVADTGILITHVDFEGRARATFDSTLSAPTVCDSSIPSCATDRDGHGTHCAGTIGGKLYGVAKEVTLHAVKILGDDGFGSWSWFVEALEFVETSTWRPAVFSASLGGRGIVSSVREAIDDAVAKGIAVVVAAGNNGDTETPDACKYSPAHVPNAITVGATRDDDERSGFSSYGSCLDIFAPGSQIRSTHSSCNTCLATLSGTSMACPHVAGAVALLLQEDPSLSVSMLTAKLLARATRDAVRDAKTGSPNLLLYAGAKAPGPTPPLPPKGSLPVNCSFEDPGLCGLWHQSNADTFDWRMQQGRTSSQDTGPGTAPDGDYYMYIEASYPRQNGDVAVLESSPLAYAGPMTMEFLYHMYGNDIDTLTVRVGKRIAWSTKGNQGDTWFLGSVPLPSRKKRSPVVSFAATRGAAYQGDIAIDSVKFVPARTTIVVIGSSRSSNTKCVTTSQPGLYCPPDAGGRGVRVNFDHADKRDAFMVSADASGRTCATRTDSPRGWGMDLRIRCSLGPP